MRNGDGIWVSSHLDYTGLIKIYTEWKNDMPNGHFVTEYDLAESVFAELEEGTFITIKLEGNVINGLYNGQIESWDRDNRGSIDHWIFQYTIGNVYVIEDDLKARP